jgi:hypothetical protein
MTGEQGNRTPLQDAVAAAILLGFKSHHSALVHTNDMLDVLDVIQLALGDTMLFYDEVVPVRASAGEDNRRARTTGQKFAIRCMQNGNIGW